MTTRKLAVAVWSAAILTLGIWWPLSYRYSGGFIVSAPVEMNPIQGRRILWSPVNRGMALTSGMGKAVIYLSWSSAFTRKGAFFEPVLAHEFPHPWFGFQNEGGRLWISFPVGLIFFLISASAFLHLCLKGS